VVSIVNPATAAAADCCAGPVSSWLASSLAESTSKASGVPVWPLGALTVSNLNDCP
jgi:hypothetical protein